MKSSHTVVTDGPSGGKPTVIHPKSVGTFEASERLLSTHPNRSSALYGVMWLDVRASDPLLTSVWSG